MAASASLFCAYRQLFKNYVFCYIKFFISTIYICREKNVQNVYCVQALNTLVVCLNLPTIKHACLYMNYHVVLDEEDSLFILLVLLEGHLGDVKVIPTRSDKSDVPHSLMGKVTQRNVFI